MNHFAQRVGVQESAAFRPSFIDHPTAWVGHIPFVHWLISELQPRRIVELGTHTGNSYFAMCETVKNLGFVDTELFAIDTWRGDKHAGFYGDEVFERVSNINFENFAGFSNLVRATFDEASQNFSNSSIDLLHIDGLHTYDAVRKDLETWMPKVASGGVIMLHDTSVKRDDFGVYRLWEEISGEGPSLNFSHSNGLGVIQIGQRRSGVPLFPQDRVNREEMVAYFNAAGDFMQELCDSKLAFEMELTGANEQIQGFLDSWSWRITRPLRILGGVISKQKN